MTSKSSRETSENNSSVVFEEDSQCFGEGKDELPVEQPQQQSFREVLGKEERTLLRARWLGVAAAHRPVQR